MAGWHVNTNRETAPASSVAASSAASCCPQAPPPPESTSRIVAAQRSGSASELKRAILFGRKRGAVMQDFFFCVKERKLARTFFSPRVFDSFLFPDSFFTRSFQEQVLLLFGVR